MGGFFGAWIYQLFIGIHIPSEIDELEEEVRRIQYDKTHNASQFFNKPPLPHHHLPYHISMVAPQKENGKIVKVGPSSIPKITHN